MPNGQTLSSANRVPIREKITNMVTASPCDNLSAWPRTENWSFKQFDVLLLDGGRDPDWLEASFGSYIKVHELIEPRRNGSDGGPVKEGFLTFFQYFLSFLSLSM
jgi:hypothetical protein